MEDEGTQNQYLLCIYYVVDRIGGTWYIFVYFAGLNHALNNTILFNSIGAHFVQ